MGGRNEGPTDGVPFQLAAAVSPHSASGLRPAAAYVGVAAVLALVAGRSYWIQSFAEGAQPDATRLREAPSDRFSIVDRTGRSLAASVECFDVTLSPRAMWRSHTPDHMAAAIAAVLDNPMGERWTPRRALERSMPVDFMDERLPGRLAPSEPRLLWFEDQDLDAVRSWLGTGAARGREATAALHGLSLVQRGRDSGPVWTLALEPVACLSRRTRAEQLPTRLLDDGTEQVAAPERWTRRLLDDLVALVGKERILARMQPSARARVQGLGSLERTEALRDALWSELMPTRFRVLARGVDPLRAHAIRDLMEREAVSPWQIQLVARTERRHPTRPGGVPVAPHPEAALANTDDAFALLGHWGVLDEERAAARATRDRELRPHVLPWDSAEDPFEAYRRSLVVDQRPWSGVELHCWTELENGPWAGLALETHGRTYASRSRYVARDRRRAWKDGVPNYFDSAADASVTPRMEVTLDAHLQEALHAEIGRLMDVHRPALAMGIAVDVATGDVLALDSQSAYAYSGFAPVLHVFTPGSTFKALIMAMALDAGVTYPAERFPTFAGRGLTIGTRNISEAEGAPKVAEVSAAEGLAHSVNAVLVQIALRMDARELRDRILRLGYAAPPGAGLGPERSGAIPELIRGTWRRPYEHASVGFGHEIGTTLWQHATALATLMRGGEALPLRLVRALEKDGQIWEHQLAEPVRVLGEQACREVREMMALGANLGTGRHVARAVDHPEFLYIGTKTGTTEKVSSELCVHLELAALAEASAAGTKWTKEARRALFELPKPHRRSSCYTSSMCAVATLGEGDEAREIMVLIVADDPAGAERFGSKVTGETAIAVLRAAFGLESRPDPVSGAPREEGGRRAAAPRAPRDTGADAPLRSPEGRVESPLGIDWLDDDLPWAAEDVR